MDQQEINKARLLLKTQILRNATFHGYETEYNQVLDLLKKTIEISESNSALLIGPRGAGKTTLLNSVLNELQGCKSFPKSAVLVRLHGLTHTDDRLALKAITSQMQLENVVDGKVFGSFAENLAFLLACLKSGEKNVSKSVIFILDEFDLFCFHHNQTLLYNLFDVSQSAQTPICVLGATCRLDVVELLEKRVKSRFSHRQIFLFPGEKSLLQQRLTLIEHLLVVGEENRKLKNAFQKDWNKNIEALINNKKFKTLMQHLLDVDTSEQTIKNVLLILVSKLGGRKKFLTLQDFEEQLKLLDTDEMVQVLLDLSVLELCLIISMKHHMEIYDNQAMNFEMVFARYLKFVNANSNVQTVQRPVIMKAFEHLQNLELIAFVSTTGGRLQKEYRLFKLLVTPQQICEAVQKASGLPTEVVQWANSSLL